MVSPRAVAGWTEATLGCNLEDRWNRAELRSTEEMADLIEIVTGAMTDLGYSPRDVRGTRLAISEALANAQHHGNRCDPRKSIAVRYKIGHEQALVEITDQGRGFIPSAVPDPTSSDRVDQSRGRGMFLMRAYMTSVRFNERGNSVTLCKSPST